ncbi:MAG: polyprenyl synthetase family protein [Deltaproteobacteria bacterium]|nr:polyprenyl synthetase family protein [Deltaproteobacteria bacterium]
MTTLALPQAPEGRRMALAALTAGGAHEAFLAALALELQRALAGADARALALALAPDAKRVRPRLLFELACALGVEGTSPSLVRAAVAVELIHTASLIHDDVIDMAERRRGLPSVNAELGNPAAVLVGDEVLCRALGALGDVAGGALVAPCIHAVAAMTRGALKEIEAGGGLDLGDEEWTAIAGDKTGALFGLCGTLAALLAGRAACVAPFAAGARALGVAFQAADDVADLADGSDLDEKNPNLAVLCAARADAGLRDRLLRAWARARWQGDERAALVRALVRSAGVGRALTVADDALARARAAFGEHLSSAGVQRALAAGEGYLAHARSVA